jgi:hypothetical protein
MPSLPGYVYAEQDGAIYVNLFMNNTADIVTGSGTKLRITQQTGYPWSGDLKIGIDPEQPGTLTVKVRVPGWARNEAGPGDLYSFVDSNKEPVKLRVNGTEQTVRLESGYAVVSRAWRKGDTIELNLPMPVRRIRANPKVSADAGRVALQRGPLVYATEWVDSPDRHARNILLPAGETLKAEWRPNLLKGVEVLQGTVTAFRSDANRKVSRSQEAFTAIPYYAWANRGPGQMEVWIAEKEDAVHPIPSPTLASQSKVTASGAAMAENGVKDPKLVADQEEPMSSSDASSYYDWLPKRGTLEWILYDFPKPVKVSSVDVYWFRETGNGQIQFPASWRLLYKDGSAWKPVETTDAFGTAPDRFNHLSIKPVTTGGLRLEVQLKPDKSAALSEWKVN